MKIRMPIFFMGCAMAGCIGVDHLEDPVVGERIEVSPLQVALMPTQSTQLTASYFNVYGVEEEADLVWTSSDPQVASVNENGLLLASQRRSI
jgi:hypothetical protein